MTVTLELKPETEKRLAEKARQNGLPIETFIEVFIEDNLDEEYEAEPKRKSFQEKITNGDWLAEFDKWVDSHRTDTPLLSDEALRRENIYEDRF